MNIFKHILNTEQISDVQDKAKETVRSNLNNPLLSTQQAAQEHFQKIFVICTFDWRSLVMKQFLVLRHPSSAVGASLSYILISLKRMTTGQGGGDDYCGDEGTDVLCIIIINTIITIINIIPHHHNHHNYGEPGLLDLASSLPLLLNSSIGLLPSPPLSVEGRLPSASYL